MSLWSTALRNAMMGVNGSGGAGLRSIFSGYAVLNLYSGTVPANADAQVSVWNGGGTTNVTAPTASTVNGTTLLATAIRSASAVNPWNGANQYGGLTTSQGLVFLAPSSGVLAGDFGTIWKFYGAQITTGTPTFWRLVIAVANAGVTGLTINPDLGTQNTTDFRVQGTFGSSTQEFVTGSGTLTNGTDQPVSICNVNFPIGV